MKRIPLYAMATAMSLVLSATLPAQGLRMTIRPDSKLTLAGSSNVHDWACRTTTFVATVDVDAGFESSPWYAVERPITSVAVDVPVKTLKCGHGKMDSNMYKALRADSFPDIKYALTSYTVVKDSATADSFVAHTVGELTVSGKTINVEIPIKAVRQPSGGAVGTGSVKLLMTDFGIKPPVALLGTLRTKNQIEIAFEVLLDKGVVVALARNEP